MQEPYFIKRKVIWSAKLPVWDNWLLDLLAKTPKLPVQVIIGLGVF